MEGRGEREGGREGREGEGGREGGRDGGRDGGPLSVLRCVVMYCLTRGRHAFYVMAIMVWVHIAWIGCIIGNPSEAEQLAGSKIR